MASHYARGARVENQVADHLRERGYDVIRSAGSKGAADLVALSEGEVLLIQVKIGASILPGPADRTRLMRIAGRNRLTRAVVAYRDPDSRTVAFRWRELTGTGPKDYQDWTPREIQA